MSDVEIRFVGTATGRYEIFLLPYAASILLSVPRSAVRLVTDDWGAAPREGQEGLALLEEWFPGRLERVRFPADLRGLQPHSRRWLLDLDLGDGVELTYVGDVDVLISEPDVAQVHRAFMDRLQLPYSNVVRPRQDHLTGLQCVRTAEYYRAVRPHLGAFLELARRRTLLDEQLLHALCKRSIGLPPLAFQERPVHGFNLSPNREPAPHGGRPGWGNVAEHRSSYLALRAHPLWRELQPAMGKEYVALLERLDALVAT